MNFSLKKKKKFDFMSLNKVLEHTMSLEKMILKIRKLLKLNGIFYI